VRNDYTFRWAGGLYQIERGSIVSGMRGAAVRIEQRLDDSLAVRYGDRYVKTELCLVPVKAAAPARAVQAPSGRRTEKPGAAWRKNFDLSQAPKIWQAAKATGHGETPA
jgi:hypothetical protein